VPSTPDVAVAALTPSTWVYAVGRIDARFPSISVEREFQQAAARLPSTSGLTDSQVRHQVLSSDENRYLVRQHCWVLTIQGLDTYVLAPRDPADFAMLAQSLRPEPKPQDLDLVVGVVGPPAPVGMCNGLTVPMVFFDQVYSFDRDALLNALPKPEKGDAKAFSAAAANAFDRLQLLGHNPGSSSRSRACNYLAVRYPRLYQRVAEAFDRDESLAAVDVRPSQLSGPREIVDVIFSFTNRRTDVVSKEFARVDVSDEFPFLVTKMAPYFDY
jgi:hypothetical protein